VQWVIEHILRHAGSGAAWHSKWKAEYKLNEDSDDVRHHEFLCKLLDTALTYDQINAPEHAHMELVARELQLIEERTYEGSMKLAPKAKNGAKGQASGGLEDRVERNLFAGAPQSRGNLCVSPDLSAWIALQLRDEAAVAKERRKAREERALRTD